MKLVVLWVFFSVPWQFGPIPMSSGWYSAFVYQDMHECQAALGRIPRTALCLNVNELPDEQLSQVVRRVELGER
jgi:hypothetical protein